METLDVQYRGSAWEKKGKDEGSPAHVKKKREERKKGNRRRKGGWVHRQATTLPHKLLVGDAPWEKSFSSLLHLGEKEGKEGKREKRRSGRTSFE